MSKADQIRALRERLYAESQRNAVNNAQVSRPVSNKPSETEPLVINTNVRRQREWRTRNLELNRQRARDGMRKRRAAAKEST